MKLAGLEEDFGQIAAHLDRESRAFISMTMYSLLFGLRAYWTCTQWHPSTTALLSRHAPPVALTLHSPTTPTCRTILMAALRSMWYSSSVSVWEGATTIESPVCVPSGSKFSMLQQMIVFCRAACRVSA